MKQTSVMFGSFLLYVSMAPSVIASNAYFSAGLHAYRTDQDIPSTQFYKVCVTKDGKIVKLLYSETEPNIDCKGAQFADVLPIVPYEPMVSDNLIPDKEPAQYDEKGKELPRENNKLITKIKNQLQRSHTANPKDVRIAGDVMQRGELSLDGSMLDHKGVYHVGTNGYTLDFHEKPFMPARYKTFVAPVPLKNKVRMFQPASWGENSRWRIQLTDKATITASHNHAKKNDDQTILRHLVFNSNADRGPDFDNDDISATDLVLDSVSMADHSWGKYRKGANWVTDTGDRLELVACETHPGIKGKSKSLDLYLQRPELKINPCFPVGLTRSINLVHHTLQVYLENCEIKDSNHKYIPPYGDKSSYEVVDKTQPKQDNKKDIKFAVIKKGVPDIELLAWTTTLEYKVNSEKLIRIGRPEAKDNLELYLPKLKKEKSGVIGEN